jgi:1-deoxy-D-xylulose-5-phosphate reductoisomerase
VAVAAFLDRRIGFLDIPRLIETVLDKVAYADVHELQDVLDADAAARRAAEEWIKQ